MVQSYRSMRLWWLSLFVFSLASSYSQAHSLVVWGDRTCSHCNSGPLVAISASMEHSLALKSDGSLAGWGRDDRGQATVPAGNDFVAIAAGYEHSLALKSDGSLVGWGGNAYGEVTVPGGNDFVAIAAGCHYSLVLKLDDPVLATQELIADVAALNLHKGIRNSLGAKLESALNALDDLNENNDVAAVNSLQAFINAVEAQRGKKITEEQADLLVAAAQSIIALLTGG